MRVIDSLSRIALILAVGFWGWIIYGWLSAHKAPLLLVIAGGIVLGAAMLLIAAVGVFIFFMGKRDFDDGMAAIGGFIVLAVIGVSICWFY